MFIFCLLGFLSGDYFFKDLLSDFLLVPGAWCVPGMIIEQIDLMMKNLLLESKSCSRTLFVLLKVQQIYIITIYSN